MKTKLLRTKDYLLLIDEEAETKKYGYLPFSGGTISGFCTIKSVNIDADFANVHKQKLVFENGSIIYFDNFNDRQVKKLQSIIAYYPLTKEAKELDLPLLPNPFENEVNIEKLAINSFGHKPTKDDNDIILSLGKGYIRGFQAGYKAAQSRQLSLEDVKKAFREGQKYGEDNACNAEINTMPSEEEYIQSLTSKQLPKEFIISDKFSTFEENIKYGKYIW